MQLLKITGDRLEFAYNRCRGAALAVRCSIEAVVHVVVNELSSRLANSFLDSV